MVTPKTTLVDDIVDGRIERRIIVRIVYFGKFLTSRMLCKLIMLK